MRCARTTTTSTSGATRDNAPPPELHDVRAHLHGGVPKAEVLAKQALVDAHVLDPKRLFKDRPAQAGSDGRYFDFADGIVDKAELKKRLDTDPGMATREQELTGAVETWWKKAQRQLAELSESKALMPTRASLLASFEKAVRPLGLLDHFQVTGVIATWWGDAQNDLKGLAAQGFAGLVEAWATSIRAALEDDEVKDNPLDHPLTKRLMPQYLADIAECEAKKAELEATIKAAQPTDDQDDEPSDGEEKLPDEEVKALKEDLGVAKKKLKTLQSDFVKQLDVAIHKLDEAARPGDSVRRPRLRRAQPGHRPGSRLPMGLLRQERSAVLPLAVHPAAAPHHRLHRGPRAGPSPGAAPHAGVLARRRARHARLGTAAPLAGRARPRVHGVAMGGVRMTLRSFR